MKILVTGLCTLHLGRLENGNIGNYYIIEPFFRELHRVFPEAEIVTTFQMTEHFCKSEGIRCLPLSSYYAWSEYDVDLALKEYAIAQIYGQTGQLIEETPYLMQVTDSDLIIDVSGEMWGDKANPVGKDRMLVNLLKIRTAQLMQKKTVLFAGTVGPFQEERTNMLAKITFENYNLATIRESETTRMLQTMHFNTENIKEYPCPSFLFEPASDVKMQSIFAKEKITGVDKPTIGMVVCGFNMTEAPYDKWPRQDEEYTEYALTVEHMVNKLGARVVLMSHSNGFDLTPEICLKPGRDYPIVKQLQRVVQQRGLVKDQNDVLCIDNAYTPAQTKAIIGQFDLFVTGRMHASVGSISQFVPTVFIMHAQGSKSTKIIGFSKIVGLEEYVSAAKAEELIEKIDLCFANRVQIRAHLHKRIPEVQKKAREGFEALKELMQQ